MKKVIIFFFVQFLVHIWDIGPSTLAHIGFSTPLRPQFELSFAEGPSSVLSKNKEAAMLGHNHIHVYNPIDLKESLQTYLKNPPKERKKLYPFFEMSQPHTTHTKLINQMLQSERDAWAEKIQDLLDLESANEQIALWNFLLELIKNMPTPAVQVTLMAALKEQEKILLREGSVNKDMKNILDEVKLTCVQEIKKHVVSIESKIKSDRFKNIFTKREQEKLGIYKMKLEKEWLASQENDLFEYWASHMDVYLKVKGSFKGILESQVILMKLIEARKKSFEIFKPVPDFVTWMVSKIDELTSELINSIKSLNDEEVVKFASVQSELRDGFDIMGTWSLEETKKLLVFWSNNIPFYLEIKHIKAKESWLPYLEKLILQDPNHMETVMKDFLKTPSPPNSKEFSLNRFLKFHAEKTRTQTLKKISEKGLTFKTAV